MNTADNNSRESVDGRPITRIIMEKAQFGSTPIAFTLKGDTVLHPVQWTRHPDLHSVHFSDGSIIYVGNDAPAPQWTQGGFKKEPDIYVDNESDAAAKEEQKIEDNLEELQTGAVEGVVQEQAEANLKPEVVEAAAEAVDVDHLNASGLRALSRRLHPEQAPSTESNKK